MDSNHFELMKQGTPDTPTVTKFLVNLAVSRYNDSSNVEDDGGSTTTGRTPLRVGLDAYVHSANFAKELSDAFDGAAGDVVESSAALAAANGDDDGASSPPPAIAVIDTLDGKPNVVDSIWEGRPALPKNPFRVHVSSLLCVGVALAYARF